MRFAALFPDACTILSSFAPFPFSPSFCVRARARGTKADRSSTLHSPSSIPTIFLPVSFSNFFDSKKRIRDKWLFLFIRICVYAYILLYFLIFIYTVYMYSQIDAKHCIALPAFCFVFHARHMQQAAFQSVSERVS